MSIVDSSASLRVAPAASAKAACQSAEPWVTLELFNAALSRVLSDSAATKISGVSPTRIRVRAEAGFNPLMMALTDSLAESNREGEISVAFIEADASNKTMTDPDATVGTCNAGRAKAKINAARISNCKMSNKLRFSF